MIKFQGRMYNLTTGEYCDTSPRLYSFAKYYGYTGEQPSTSPIVSFLEWLAYGVVGSGDTNSGNDVMLGHEGETLTNIPYTRYEMEGNNIGLWFEYYAKQYYYTNEAWPTLRLLTSNDTTDYYLEWSRDNATGFNVKANALYTRWENCLQWDDTINVVDGVPRYTSFYSYVFLSASSANDLQSLTVVYSGAFHYDSEGGNLESLVSFPLSISVANSAAMISAAGTFLGRVNGVSFYKTYDGPSLYVFTTEQGKDVAAGWKGVSSIYPVVSQNSTTPIAPFKPDYSYNSPSSTGTNFQYQNTYWRCNHSFFDYNTLNYEARVPIFENVRDRTVDFPRILEELGVEVGTIKVNIYEYLQGVFETVQPDIPQVDPDDIPPEDEAPEPITPDNPDPYYDPESDPGNPEYKPSKDPNNPSYDPTTPSTPYTPPSTTSDKLPQVQPTQDTITTPETPPSYVTTNDMFTLYNPSGGDLTSLANFLWSATWSVDTFKKIFANPLDCILGLMVMPHLNASVSTKTMNVGNISTGVSMHYFTSQFFDFDCGTFDLLEYYNSYLDYAPYTKVNIFLPYIGDKQLSTDEVMNKTLGVKYRFDLATGDCVAFITVGGSVLYSFSGNCAARLPLAGNNWNGIIPALTGVAISAGSMAAGLPALGAASAAAVSTMKETISHTGNISGSAGLMGIQTPYLIVTRPRQALPLSQNSFTGYPSFMTESLGSLHGYTEVEQCHLEHVPATGAELEEIERLLKEGVLF